MNKTELIDAMAADAGITKAAAKKSLESFLGNVEGTLKKGESIVVGETYGRARSMTDFSGKELKTAGPATPVQIIGLNDYVSPGDTLNTVKNDREARKVVDNRIRERQDLEQASEKKMSLEDFFSDATSGFLIDTIGASKFALASSTSFCALLRSAL